MLSLLHTCHSSFSRELGSAWFCVKVCIKCLPGVCSLSILSCDHRWWQLSFATILLMNEPTPLTLLTTAVALCNEMSRKKIFCFCFYFLSINNQILLFLRGFTVIVFYVVESQFSPSSS